MFTYRSCHWQLLTDAWQHKQKSRWRPGNRCCGSFAVYALCLEIIIISCIVFRAVLGTAVTAAILVVVLCTVLAAVSAAVLVVVLTAVFAAILIVVLIAVLAFVLLIHVSAVAGIVHIAAGISVLHLNTS